MLRSKEKCASIASSSMLSDTSPLFIRRASTSAPGSRRRTDLRVTPELQTNAVLRGKWSSNPKAALSITNCLVRGFKATNSGKTNRLWRGLFDLSGSSISVRGGARDTQAFKPSSPGRSPAVSLILGFKKATAIFDSEDSNSWPPYLILALRSTVERKHSLETYAPGKFGQHVAILVVDNVGKALSDCQTGFKLVQNMFEGLPSEP